MTSYGFESQIVRAAYAAAADEYAESFGDDLGQLELDRRILDVIAHRGGALGAVLDIGCGPAHISAHLIGQGAAVVGVDFTWAMLETARRRSPGLPVVAADLRALPVRAGAAGAIVAFYVLQHLPRTQLASGLDELRRVLRPDGLLALAVHEGSGEYRIGDVTGTLYRADELTNHLADAGLLIESVDHREPLAHEHQGPRVYVVARVT